MLVVVGLLLAGAVLAAVDHAEVVAHRVGEPFGSLILAVAVTVIEVGLIVMLMTQGGKDTATLARDTVFAAAMIACNGIFGMSLLIGALRRGGGDASTPRAPPRCSPRSRRWPRSRWCCRRSPRAARAPSSPVSSSRSPRVVSLALYVLFVFVQTVRHRDYFVPEGGGRPRSTPRRARTARCS